MVKRFIAALLCIAALAGLCACVGDTEPELSVAGDDMLGVRQYYRDSSLIVSGTCSLSHINEAGRGCSDVVVDKVIAGDALPGDVVHCTGGGMTDGAEYLLYLSLGSDKDYAEDIQGYTIVSGSPILISNGRINVGGVSLSLDDVLADIENNLSRIVTAPSDRYYYSRIGALADACDVIFIGTVTDMPALTGTMFRSRSGGLGSDITIPAAAVSIRALGSVKGSLSYGDEVTLMYAPSLAAEIIDAATLVPLSGGLDALVEPEEGATYLFFLIRSTDAKQSYYFTINPIQGYIRVTGEALAASSANGPARGYYSLSNLVRAIRHYSGQ